MGKKKAPAPQPVTLTPAQLQSIVGAGRTAKRPKPF